MRLFRIFIPTSVLTLLISEITIVFFCYVLASSVLIDVDPWIFLFYDSGATRIGFVVASLLAGLYFQDLYTHLRVHSKTLLLQQLCLALGVAFLVQGFLSYGDPAWVLPRWTMMVGSAICLVSLFAWRVMFTAAGLTALGAQKILFLGRSPVLAEIAARLKERPELGFSTIGYLDDEPEGKLFDGIPWLGNMKSIRQVVEEHKPDRIVVGLIERRNRLPVNDLLDLRLSGLRVEEAASAFEDAFGRVCSRELRPDHLIYTAELGPSVGKLMFQSLYSFFIALTGAVLTLPIMLLVALAVKLSSSGPILFRQTRVGRNGVPFILYKFRSMRQDAEAHTGAVWATENDLRVTPVGRWLRLLRFDELPQLFNVLRGEMSIVGPRPERPEFVKMLTEKIPYYRQRHCVKPGITGLAQISHKYSGSLEDTITKLEYDLYYIKNLTPALDAYIIFHTLKVMLLGRGAQ
jgi:sugar transferase (PEP-CTERM system associated)